jgi:hypothetical protein
MSEIAYGRDEYRDTFIAVAEDCPVTAALVPEPYRGRATIATIQHELIAEAPYRWRHSDVLVLTALAQEGVEPEQLDPDELATRREAYFDRPRACLRSSPLPKRFGVFYWGGGIVHSTWVPNETGTTWSQTVE